ncbi:DUF1289 domain-containing protein [Sphingomonas japonica]|uniref:DUF1289 domain-containing protein n=1 Tax=Sphingomonas japonica TaxID=511662 RepID=A0ABX0U1L7_9SPHN|nr:DUF1289 domain-containing protein [Sphingomonas japonica]NIJ22682.1 hypothetical protein [Sphingomonas japonica]
MSGADDDFITFEPAATVLSPCVLVCAIDAASGWCLGCGRSASEIAQWPFASDAERQALLDRLPERLCQLQSR